MSIHSSLGTFRTLIETIGKDSTNPHFKSKYADLPSILEAIKDPLTKSGLSVSHNMEYDNDSLIVVTTLTEIEKGEQLKSIFPVFGSKPQEIGSSITYARRYNLQALLDLPIDDDDGNSANNASPIKKQQYQDDNKPWLNDKDFDDIAEKLESGEVFSKSALREDYKISKAMAENIKGLINSYPSQFVD